MLATTILTAGDPVWPAKPLTIWTATDLHYLSPQLTDYGALFTDVIMAGDAKITEYSPQILDAFCSAVISRKPDALILTGDITFNGELLSLQEASEKLAAVKKAGIPVLVLPGNHDINYYKAYRYSGDQAYNTKNISQEQFREICWEFGPSKAVMVDKNSFSYVYALTEDFWILTLDANTEAASGRIRSETLLWAEEQLRTAQKRGIVVLAATHQNVLPQSKMMSFGYVISNHKEVSALFRNYGVKWNLSGHVHMQHKAEEDGLADIATGSMAVAALRYGIVRLNEKRAFSYEMASVSEKQEEAQERFHKKTHAQVKKTLSGLNITEREAVLMTEFASDINYRYFTGNLEKKYFSKHSEAWALWQKHGADTFFGKYLRSMREEFC